MPLFSSRYVGPTADEIAADPGLDQATRIGREQVAELQTERGIASPNNGPHSRTHPYERGYVVSPQRFRHKPMAMEAPPATEQGFYLPGKDPLWPDE